MSLEYFSLVYFRKLTFKQYEERKNAAEKITAEAEQLELMFKKHKTSNIQVKKKMFHLKIKTANKLSFLLFGEESDSLSCNMKFYEICSHKDLL